MAGCGGGGEVAPVVATDAAAAPDGPRTPPPPEVVPTAPDAAPGTATTTPPPSCAEESVTAAQVRSRAETALAEGRFEEAVVDGYRAVTLRQVERGRLDDLPQATASEVARTLGAQFPGRRGRVDAAALLFDLVLYGERSATRDQALGVLGLDDELAGAR